MNDHNVIIQEIKNRLSLNQYWLESSGLFLSRFKSANWNLFLQGGMVRDSAIQVLTGIKIPMSDLDFVVEGCPSQEHLRSVLAGFEVVQNSFGGFKVKFGDLNIDLWRIENHLGIADSILKLGVGGLLGSVTTSMDAIAFDVFNERIIDQGCLNSIARRTIDLNVNGFWNAKVAPHHIAHIAKMMGRTGFLLSISLQARLCEYVQHIDINESFYHLSKDVGAYKSKIWIQNVLGKLGVSSNLSVK